MKLRALKDTVRKVQLKEGRVIKKLKVQSARIQGRSRQDIKMPAITDAAEEQGKQALDPASVPVPDGDEEERLAKRRLLDQLQLLDDVPMQFKKTLPVKQ